MKDVALVTQVMCYRCNKPVDSVKTEEEPNGDLLIKATCHKLTEIIRIHGYDRKYIVGMTFRGVAFGPGKFAWQFE